MTYPSGGRHDAHASIWGLLAARTDAPDLSPLHPGRRFQWLVAIAAFLLCITVYGALPFLTMPTVGQAVWTTAFAQSISNQSLLALTANNFGLPGHPAISFGLAAAYPEAILLKAGLAPADAYTLTFTLWLGVAFGGARRLAMLMGTTANRGSLMAATWLCLPLVWAHAGYSMLSLGIALFPAYAWAVARFLDALVAARGVWQSAGLLLASCITSAFMDGYTFVMFAVVATMFAAWCLLAQGPSRHRIAIIGVPTIIVSFGVAYVLYSRFIGLADYWVPPLEAFRGWGIDLAFLVEPSRGISFLLDTLHLSDDRTIDVWYGDPSVWETTFILPLVVLAGVAGWCMRRERKVVHLALAIALVGLFLALGPSVKAWSVKTSPAEVTAGDPHFMPASAARFSTHTAFFSTRLPGLKNMRAPYRWIVLGAFGFWLAIVLLHGRHPRQRWLLVGTLLALALGLPPPHEHMENATGYRKMFNRLDHDVTSAFSAAVKPGETFTVLPYGNDFLAAYAASRINARTQNVGGDKNLAMALASWPTYLQRLLSGQLPSDPTRTVVGLLLDGYSDTVVIPNYQEPMAAHFWPCLREAPEKISRRVVHSFGAGWPCPAAVAAQNEPLVAGLESSPLLTVQRSPLFTLIRLKPALRQQAATDAYYAHLLNQKYQYPIIFAGASQDLSWIIPSGWYDVESDHVWSGKTARLNLPVPASCLSGGCSVELAYWVLGAAKHKPVTVHLASHDGTWSSAVRASPGEIVSTTVPLPAGAPMRRIDIQVDGATSPFAMGDAADGRVMGIALKSLLLHQAPLAPTL
jgi:hypothetical protein